MLIRRCKNCGGDPDIRVSFDDMDNVYTIDVYCPNCQQHVTRTHTKKGKEYDTYREAQIQAKKKWNREQGNNEKKNVNNG